MTRYNNVAGPWEDNGQLAFIVVFVGAIVGALVFLTDGHIVAYAAAAVFVVALAMWALFLLRAIAHRLRNIERLLSND